MLPLSPLTGPTSVDVTAVDGGFKVTVPAGFNGQSYVILTAWKDKAFGDDTVVTGPAIVEITNPYPSIFSS